MKTLFRDLVDFSLKIPQPKQGEMVGDLKRLLLELGECAREVANEQAVRTAAFWNASGE